MTLKASVGSPFARILSVGAATPSRVIDNEYLLQYIDSSDEWITQRTGIRERRWIGEDEDIKTLSLTAGEIKPVPAFSGAVDAGHITGIATLGDGERRRMLILLDIEQLMGCESIGLLEPALQ